jgi:hypothetical protein
MTTSLTAPTAAADPIPTTRRGTWALWGSAAGLGGVLTNMALAQTVSEEIRTGGDPQVVVEALSQGRYHLTAITGFATVVCLLFFAAGLQRWARSQASESLALRVAPLGLVASAGALIAAYGIKGQLAAYLEGGFNEKSYGIEAQYFFFMLDDLAGYFGWFGVTVTAGCIAWLAFRDRLVARWIGGLGALTVVGAAAFLLVFGFTGFSGLIAPVFLLVAGIGLSRQRA